MNGTPSSTKMARKSAQFMLAQEETEGQGAKVYRSIGTKQLPRLDPFLLLDEFHVQPPGGFIDHPHRGFETVTYVLNGSISHEDFCGHRGILKVGDVQWMTAGKGILHCEMPASSEPTRGLQLWINLPREHKFCNPRYQELKQAEIPEVDDVENNVHVKILAGEWKEKKANVFTYIPITFLVIHLSKGGNFRYSFPTEQVGIVYILDGHVHFDGKEYASHSALIFEENGEETIEIQAESNQEAWLVLIAGKPLHEPVCKRGPFVLNTDEELQQTFRDFQMAQNGFEGAHEWRSIYKHTGHLPEDEE